MVLTTTQDGAYFTYLGTLAEVTGALDDEGIGMNNIVSFIHDGTDYVALVHK